MEVRYTGPLQDGVDVDTEGGTVHAARMAWVDLPTDLARSLAKQDVWELAGARKAANTRRRAAAETEPEQPAEQPEQSGEEA